MLEIQRSLRIVEAFSYRAFSYYKTQIEFKIKNQYFTQIVSIGVSSHSSRYVETTDVHLVVLI
jgi:uncharacterized membrane protein